MFVVDVSCSRSDSCSVVDRGDPASATFAITGEAGAHLSSDLSQAGVAHDPSGSVVDAVRLVCQTVDSWYPACVASSRLGALPADTKVMLTGTGAELSWTRSSKPIDGANGFTKAYSYAVTYDDVSDRFGDVDVVSATVIPTTHVAHQGGSPDPAQTTSFEVDLKKVAPHVFQGTATILAPGGGDWETDLDSVGIAFHVDGTWDSNLGKNYDL